LQTSGGAVIGAIFGGVVVLALPYLFDENVTPAAAVLLALFGWYAAVLVHECGHAIAGLAAGGRLISISVGPVKIVRGAAGFRFMRQYKVAIGGMTLVAPPLDRPIAPYMTQLVAGGPLASLMSAAVAYLLVFQTAGHLRTVLATYAVLSSFCVVVSMIPFSSSGLLTDGTRLLIAARGGVRAQRMNAVATIYALLAAGTRLREMPTSIISCLAESIKEGRDGVMASTMLHSWALDRDDIEEAEKWLAQALAWQQYWPAPLRASMYLSAAFMSARYHRDAVKAREWLTKAGRAPFSERSSRIISEAAVLIAEGKQQESLKRLAEATVLVDHAPFEGVRTMLRDSIADLQKLASKQLTSAGVAS
jgi:hypothetical protein